MGSLLDPTPYFDQYGFSLRGHMDLDGVPNADPGSGSALYSMRIHIDVEYLPDTWCPAAAAPLHCCPGSSPSPLAGWTPVRRRMRGGAGWRSPPHPHPHTHPSTAAGPAPLIKIS